VTATKIFENLPVGHIDEIMEFFAKLGFKFKLGVNENATFMIVGEDMFVMLLEICDTSKNTEAIVALAIESREKVDLIANKAIEYGGRKSRKPQDHGWMYGRSFEDINRYLWEIIYMEQSAKK
jgi:predicted lactoylglutathione lyase